MTDEEIGIEVMRKYPLTEKEKQGCKIEIARMKHIREYYKQRLEKGNITEEVRIKILPEDRQGFEGQG